VKDIDKGIAIGMLMGKKSELMQKAVNITENGTYTYDPADDNADGYSGVTVGVEVDESEELQRYKACCDMVKDKVKKKRQDLWEKEHGDQVPEDDPRRDPDDPAYDPDLPPYVPPPEEPQTPADILNGIEDIANEYYDAGAAGVEKIDGKDKAFEQPDGTIVTINISYVGAFTDPDVAGFWNTKFYPRASTYQPELNNFPCYWRSIHSDEVAWSTTIGATPQHDDTTGSTYYAFRCTMETSTGETYNYYFWELTNYYNTGYYPVRDFRWWIEEGTDNIGDYYKVCMKWIDHSTFADFCYFYPKIARR